MTPLASDGIMPETTPSTHGKASQLKIMHLRLSGLALRKHRPRFLDLPRELRDMIYSYALISSITRWEARHLYYCKHRDRTGTSERPPFTMNFHEKRFYLGVQATPGSASSSHDCSCARHHTALGLLRTSRQIRAETMKMFYSQNVLYFNDGFELRDFLANLNPECRSVIRHISLVGINFDASSSSHMRANGTSFQEQVWDALRSCPSLRYLELTPEHVGKRINGLLRMRENRVKDISIAQCVSLQQVRQLSPPPDILDRVWIRVSQPVELPSHIEPVPLEEYIQKLPRKQSRAFRDCVSSFQLTVVPKCRQAVRAKLEAIYYEAPRNLNVELDPLEISINGEGRTEIWTVRVWGLPSTRDARSKFAKEEWLEDERG